MRRTLAVAAVALTLTACTPEQIAWWTHEIEVSRSSGEHCPMLAPARQLAGLPDVFDYIIWRESRCTPTAVNPDSGALGLAQIMPMWLNDLCRAGIACTRSEMLDAHTNLAAAKYVLDVQGMGAWAP